MPITGGSKLQGFVIQLSDLPTFGTLATVDHMEPNTVDELEPKAQNQTFAS